MTKDDNRNKTKNSIKALVKSEVKHLRMAHGEFKNIYCA